MTRIAGRTRFGCSLGLAALLAAALAPARIAGGAEPERVPGRAEGYLSILKTDLCRDPRIV